MTREWIVAMRIGGPRCAVESEAWVFPSRRAAEAFVEAMRARYPTADLIWARADPPPRVPRARKRRA